MKLFAEITVTVPTVWIVLAICLLVFAAWCYFVIAPLLRFLTSRLDDWAEKEKAKINAKYSQTDEYGE